MERKVSGSNPYRTMVGCPLERHLPHILGLLSVTSRCGFRKGLRQHVVKTDSKVKIQKYNNVIEHGIVDDIRKSYNLHNISPSLS